MQPDILAQITQFGAAGLIAWMWLTERRAALTREKQLTDAHERLMEQRAQLDTLVRLIAENTRALSSLESSLAALHRIIERLAPSSPTSPSPAPPTPHT